MMNKFIYKTWWLSFNLLWIKQSTYQIILLSFYIPYVGWHCNFVIQMYDSTHMPGWHAAWLPSTHPVFGCLHYTPPSTWQFFLPIDATSFSLQVWGLLVLLQLQIFPAIFARLLVFAKTAKGMDGAVQMQCSIVDEIL